MSKDIKTMREYREKMNNFIMQADNKNIKRFFAIDHQVYEKGALDKKTKELMGLVASTVLLTKNYMKRYLLRLLLEDQ